MGIGEILNVNIFLPPWFQSVYQQCNQTEARGAAGGLQELASEERGEKGERGQTELNRDGAACASYGAQLAHSALECGTDF